MADGDYLYVCILVWLLIGNFKIGPSITRISFCFKPVSVLNVLPVSDSIRDEEYFDTVKVIYSVCVVVCSKNPRIRT